MFEKLKEIIEEKLNAEGAAITEETSFKEDLDADSLDRERFPPRSWRSWLR